MPVLGYWNIRGLGQPIRLLLNYVGVEYEEKLYSWGPAPEFVCDEWFAKDKPGLGMDFPNLPYYFDGDNKITQSSAILKYLARKYDLEGSTETERIRADMVLFQIIDLRNDTLKLQYGPDFKDKIADFRKELPARLEKFEKFLGRNDWFAGSKLTYVDFSTYELIKIQTYMTSTCLDKFPKLKSFLKRFEELPKIKAYMNSDRFIAKPLNGPMAYFDI